MLEIIKDDEGHSGGEVGSGWFSDHNLATDSMYFTSLGTGISAVVQPVRMGILIQHMT